MSVYAELLAAGVPLDNHESDLYAKVTDESTRVIEQHRAPDRLTVSTFTSNIDGARWYEILFAYEPWWQAKQKEGEALRNARGH